MGCSILYHLAKLGWTDSLLVEQYQLTHGSTWHSAGLVGQLRSSISLTRMMQYSVGLYAELKELTGNDPGWHQLGGLRLASSQPRLEEIRRQAAWAKTFGLPMEIVSAEEAQERFPPMSTDGVLAAAFIPDDGYLDPSQLTFSLADAARGSARSSRPARGSPASSAPPTGASPRSRPTRAGSSARSSSTRRACTRPSSPAWSASTCRSSRTATST
jgi:glycine/D-amino acid oxidase-like deaminating enzyme